MQDESKTQAPLAGLRSGDGPPCAGVRLSSLKHDRRLAIWDTLPRQGWHSRNVADTDMDIGADRTPVRRAISGPLAVVTSGLSQPLGTLRGSAPLASTVPTTDLSLRCYNPHLIGHRREVEDLLHVACELVEPWIRAEVEYAVYGVRPWVLERKAQLIRG